MLAHVRSGARLTEVEQEKQIFRTLWKHVREMWGAPPDHPPAKLSQEWVWRWCDQDPPCQCSQEYPSKQAGALPTGKGNTQRTGKHRPAKRQLSKPGLQVSTQWPERPRTHTAQTLWCACNYTYVWSSLPIVGVVLDLGGGQHHTPSEALVLIWPGTGLPNPHTIAICPSLKVRPKDATVVTLPQPQTWGNREKEDNGGGLFKGASSC